MATRRPPLANVPHAVNSPVRPIAVTATKRTRTQVGDLRDLIHGQPPPKKQVIEFNAVDNVENVDPRRRNGLPVVVQEKLEIFPQRARVTPPTALERKLAAVRDAKGVSATQQPRVDRNQKAVDDNAESIKQWRRHYKKQFPYFVVYFESVPDEYRLKAVRQIQSLGAREEKFFSKAVTHVVTTRQIPPELPSTHPDDGTTQRKAGATLTQDFRKATSMFDATLQRRGLGAPNDIDPRRAPSTYTADILTKARELGIKIWALEKLQRILKTMLEPTGQEPADAVQYTTTGRTTGTTREADLAQLLRNEKINGPADRDMTVAGQDMNSFRGCYIYIHDMDEATRPVMVRDYAKPQTKEQGKWPQLRLTQMGRCPFIEDPAYTNKLRQQGANRAEEEEQRQHGTASARPTGLRRSPRKQAPSHMAKPLDPPVSIPSRRQSSAEGVPSLFGSTQQSLRYPPRMVHGEPVASGLQASNVTSAIRSQIVSSAAISSTAPGLGRRIGDSKEVSALKRQVLERGASVTSNHSMPSSYMNDVRGAINGDGEPQVPPPRAAKRKAQETLGVVRENDEHDAHPSKQRKTTTKKKKTVEREAKPGYCENCRDKFDDFDEHVLSRKHRKFALTQSNWDELDNLLTHLHCSRKATDTLGWMQSP